MDHLPCPLPIPLPCPFCGQQPFVGPENPEKTGDGWAFVICRNEKCHANVKVEAYELEGTKESFNSVKESSDAYKAEAIKRWNIRL